MSAKLKLNGSAVVLGLALVALLPGIASAQGEVAGQVRDETGGVLPGVTITVASPELIEGSRVAVSDGQGRFGVVDLRPGLYTVTFELAGFRRVVRDEIEVTGGATVTVDAQLAVGQLEETLTVTAATPVVDIQQAGRRDVINRELLDALPTNRTTHTVGLILPGTRITRPMVGGMSNTYVQAYITTRGKGAEDNDSTMDGIDNRKIRGRGSLQYDNYAMAQEVVVETNPASAEGRGSGLAINTIPRDGGNTFSGDVTLTGSHSAWQADNTADTGLNPNRLLKMVDINPAFGGPIVRDKLWFFGSVRYNHQDISPFNVRHWEFPDGNSFGASPPNIDPASGSPLGRDGINYTKTDNLSFRLTWQATPNMKVTTLRDHYWRNQSAFAFSAAQDHANVPVIYPPGHQSTWPTKWSWTASNRVLVEAGWYYGAYDNTIFGWPDHVLEPYVDDPTQTGPWFAKTALQDTGLGLRWVAPRLQPRRYHQPAKGYMGSVTYVTGSHQVKVGVQGRFGFEVNQTSEINGALGRVYINGVPSRVDLQANPSVRRTEVRRDLAVYAQDRWTIGRLTVNVGVRVEDFVGGVGATESAAGFFIGARSFEPNEYRRTFDPGFPVDGTIYDFTDVMPRFNVVYDLFGNAKTALKFTVGRYVDSLGSTELMGFHPISTSTDRRNWIDCRLPPTIGVAVTPADCVPGVFSSNGDNIAQTWEFGASNTVNWGFRGTNQLDPERPLSRQHTWETSVGVQQEVFEGGSVNVMWYHTQGGNLWNNRDRAFTVNDWIPFQLQNPLVASDIMTVYNFSPTASRGDTVRSISDTDRDFYDGFEVSLQARLRSGGAILGSWYTERSNRNNCDNNNPNTWRFCDSSLGGDTRDHGPTVSPPFQSQYKMSLVHPLPYDFQGAFSFSSFPGEAFLVGWNIPSSFFPGGLRTRSVNVQLLPEGEQFLDRVNQMDIKVSRAFRVGGIEFLPSFDLFNLANGDGIATQSNTYSSSTGRVNERIRDTLPGRLLRLSMLVRF